MQLTNYIVAQGYKATNYIVAKSYKATILPH